ncbi:MAG: TolC family protein, partial [Pirellulaceae bacterium]
LRFRKTLFVQLASQYYNLIRTYRQVEIDSQNYFTLVRAFRQSSAEYNAGELPRFQLDQIEQNVLAGRGRVIATCNSLENALDNLKLRMGLPTETHVNIDLSELKRLTTRDELAVTGELIQRVGRRLREEQVKRTPIRAVLLAQSVVLIERMLEAMELQRGVGDPVTGENELRVQVAQLRVESARENAELDRIALTAELRQTPLQPSRVFLRRMDLVDALLDLLERQVEFGELISNNAAEFRMQRAQLGEFRERANNLHAELDRSVETRQVDQLPQLIDQGAQLQMEIDTIVQQLDARLGFPAERPEAGEATRKSLEDAQRLLEFSEQLVTNLGAGLIPVQIEMDDAMLTALNLRLDLMNQRGDLADSWRQIKYAGDDLKAILNIQATHRVSTRRDVNRVFDFTLDESSTQVGATFDAPLNRRAQRNDFRQALIDYQAAIRQLMLLEDNIKFAVRNDLRALSLDKEQYVIDVASAALASERVITVLLELRLGIGQIAPRDFLEAQNAYAASLSNVASRHIGYIVDRTQLFVDLELLTVDERGFWRELYNENFQPDPFYQVATYGQPVYGRLVPGLWYSHLIRRMEQVPAGMSAVHNQDGDGDDPSGASPAEPLPAPPAAGHGP